MLHGINVMHIMVGWFVRRRIKMADLEFNLDSTFDENLEAFKKHLECVDPVLTEILFKHVDKIKYTGDSTREPNEGRNAFNNSLLIELENILNTTKE